MLYNKFTALSVKIKTMVFTTFVRAVSLQTVKLTARVPSIKFRKGGMSPGGSAAGSAGATQVKKKPETKGKGAKQAKGASTTTIILEELPARFKRKPISSEEMAFINNGGVA